MKYSELPEWLQTLIAQTGLPNHEEADFLVPHCKSFALCFAYLDKALAKKWLEKQSDLQRGIAEDTAERYTCHMDKAKWELLPEANMIFDRKGVGANGKTRLHAFLNSNAVELAMLVAFGVPPEALLVMDDVRKRTTVQNARMHKKNASTWDHTILKSASSQQYKLGVTTFPKQTDILLLPQLREHFREALNGLSGVHTTHVRTLQREEWGLLLLAYYASPQKVCRLATTLATAVRNNEDRLYSSDSTNVNHYVKVRGEMKAVGSSGGAFDVRATTMLTRVIRAELEGRELSPQQLRRGMRLTWREQMDRTTVIDTHWEKAWLKKMVVPYLQELAKRQASKSKLAA